jgi:hypothetical protein
MKIGSPQFRMRILAWQSLLSGCAGVLIAILASATPEV